MIINDKHKFYDYLLVGAGLFNAIFANEATRKGKKCLVIDKRNHVGGNLYCDYIEGINVHRYGPHIFHTTNESVWKYMNKLCRFNHFIYSPLAFYKGELYNLPFNMNTFCQLWKVKTPDEALRKIKEQTQGFHDSESLEGHALSIAGKDIYEKLIKSYTEKQWGRDAKELPAFIIQRIPLRFRFDNNYFDDPFQGIPVGGYNAIFEKCFEKCDVILNWDFLENPSLMREAKTVIFTGMIDAYYGYRYGQLEYRSLHFENEILDTGNYQGNAAINYTEKDVPFTRIIEHKHFEFGKQPKTVITKEYPQTWESGLEPYYPINTAQNNDKYLKYKELSYKEENIFFAGRLGSYAYYNMDRIVYEALQLSKQLLK